MSFDYQDTKLRERLRNSQALSYPEKIAIIRALVGEAYPDNPRIADLGCGEAPVFKHSVNVDIYPAKGVIVADLNKEMPLGPDAYDVVLAVDIIEHLYDVDTFVRNANKILKKGGMFIVSTPNVLYWRNRLELLFGSDRHFDHKGEHLHFFSPRSLMDLLSLNGFDAFRIYPIGISKLLPSMAGGFICVARKC